MILRKKGFTLIEMLVVIMIIAILAAALFPAIAAAIAQAKSTAVKNKGRGIWTSVLTANSEREPLGMMNVWPTRTGTSTTYFLGLISGASPICEDLKAPVLAGPGMPTAADAASFTAANNAWCTSVPFNAPSNNVSEDAFIFTRNIDFASSPSATYDPTITPGYVSGVEVKNANPSKLNEFATALGGWNLNRGIYVTYGGACVDRRKAYIDRDPTGFGYTNNLVSSSNSVAIFRP